jgi:Spy/CpxP family protein refolding chaperone
MKNLNSFDLLQYTYSYSQFQDSGRLNLVTLSGVKNVIIYSACLAIEERIQKMRKTLIALLAVGLVFSGIKNLQAQQNPSPQPQKHPKHEQVKDKLNLSDSQKKQLDELRTSMQRNAVQLRSKIQLARIDLRELLKTDDPDKAAVEKKINEIGQLQTARKMLRINHMFDMKKMLTPEQRTILKNEGRGMWFPCRGLRGNHRGLLRERLFRMDDGRGDFGKSQGMMEDRDEINCDLLGILDDQESIMDEIPGIPDNCPDSMECLPDPMGNPQ